MFKYLLSQKHTRIAFFSAGTDDRNEVLISTFLTIILGDEVYNSLKSQGQFDIFSRNHMKERSSQKDLSLVLKPENDERISDIILVDDYECCAMPGEQSFYIRTLFIAEGGDIRWKNNMYYFMGVFNTYFESSQYETIPLRESIAQMIPLAGHPFLYCDKEGLDYFPTPEFHAEMVAIGLEEVRKTKPEAQSYPFQYDLKYMRPWW